MQEVRTTRRRSDGSVDFEFYSNKARDIRAEAMADLFGEARRAIYNTFHFHAPFHGARASHR